MLYCIDCVVLCCILLIILYCIVRCYGMALKQQPKVAALWHDLGINFYRQMCLTSGAMVSVMTSKSIQALQRSVTLESDSPRHWTALGVVAASKGTTSDFLFLVFHPLCGVVVLAYTFPFHPINGSFFSHLPGFHVKCLTQFRSQPKTHVLFRRT